MEKKCCVFVDGENLRYAIVELFEPDFPKNEYLPKQADWARIFDWFVEEASPDHRCERVRAYWYVIQTLDSYPWKFPSEPDSLKRLLCRHNPFRQELESLDGIELRNRMRDMVCQLKQLEVKMRRRFDGWRIIQDGIANRHPAIEFRRAGAICHNLFTHQLGKEKAVDVKLATDLIVLRDNYDVALIVSGDQDYVPAVQAVKDFGKRVVNVAFETRSGRLLPGGARRLNQATDWSLRIPYRDFKVRLRIGSGIRPAAETTSAVGAAVEA